ncbi:Uma2 family endonuclease [Dyadobacter sp. LJ53]|uniref:Uma2 family endonuclease n=1 Tax=Dyadobacter chenwenxiniae TaxID=2906456 RepID=UPI001F33B363|nr:Uma2 family endonuclease [Dyadobacter chenwenxiniae]MCF0051044.1 Uma2 family endonuclease [Dyadobacter chenwenxiniae]
MIASSTPHSVSPKIAAAKIPNVLIHEIIDGKPYYLKGYRDVLGKIKTVEDIMGSSSLQAFLMTYLIIWIGKQIDETKFHILANEAGLHLDKKNNLAGDLLIFDSSKLTIDKINKNYASVPPVISIEVDVRIALEGLTELSYLSLKTQKLLDFGTEKVIWFLTESKKVMIATKDNDWQTLSWDQDVEVLDGISCNVGKYLKDKGSEFA